MLAKSYSVGVFYLIFTLKMRYLCTEAEIHLKG